MASIIMLNKHCLSHPIIIHYHLTATEVDLVKPQLQTRFCARGIVGGVDNVPFVVMAPRRTGSSLLGFTSRNQD